MPEMWLKFETAEVKVVRGTESKEIARRIQDGWELTDQKAGKLRSTLTFQRPRKKPSGKMIAGVSTLAVAAVTLITVGAILEDRDQDAATNQQTASEGRSETSAGSNAEPSQEDSQICDPRPGFATCKFGQTAIYSDKTRSGEVQLEITVGEPVQFTPSPNARSVPSDRPLGPVNVYFPTTIRNAAAIPIHSNFLTKSGNATQSPYDIHNVYDEGLGEDNLNRLDGLTPGQSMTFTEAFTMDTLSGIEYEIRVDGLSGYSITFTQ